MNPFLFSQFVLVSDFNGNMLVHSSYRDHIVTLSSHFNLTQVVVDSTYVCDDGYQSVLGLVLVSDPLHILECSTITFLGNSNHHDILFQLDCPLQVKQTRPRWEV